MSEVFENNSVLSLLRNFYIRNRKAILIIFSIFLIFVILYVSNNLIIKTNNVKAAKLYNDWTSQETESENGKILANKLFNQLVDTYEDSGYAQIALINQASLEAKNGNLEKALEYYEILTSSTEGYGGNKLYNKISRINTARINYALDNYDEALNVLEKYSSSSNALIHELIGDILAKQDKFDLAKEQYIIAKGKYTDETSLSIISMKISNIPSE
ncbi:MAG: tetratricopeptide repeat protein [Proteobacteria bacterium]|nr:tetratricopeptide repeat protein [Pseudomonadota bacterium]MDA0975987.1 tetratricopeptide repeat protein [Pseudomonadota bacterium]MDA1037211.1 tetratricopeptide repeat protein [Pseudomonadota bacterium]